MSHGSPLIGALRRDCGPVRKQLALQVLRVRAYLCRVGKWDSFVYALYHIRAKASACAAAVQTAGPQNLRRAEAVHLTSLLPIM